MFKKISLTLFFGFIALPCMAQGPDTKQDNQLFIAVVKGNLMTIQRLLDQGADLSATNALGYTPAETAVDRGFYKIAHYLRQRADLIKSTKPLKPVISKPIAPQPVVATLTAPPRTEPNLQLAITEPTFNPFKLEHPLQVNQFTHKAPSQFYAPPKQILPQIVKTTVPKIEHPIKPVPVSAATMTALDIDVVVKPAGILIANHAVNELDTALGLALGKAPPSSSIAGIEPCLSKSRNMTVCIEKSDWAKGLLANFAALPVSIYKRNGVINRSVVGYRNQFSNFVKSIFPAADFKAVVDHFSRRFGKPDEIQQQMASAIGKPRRQNPVLTWYGFDEKKGRKTMLRVMNYDTTSGHFLSLSEGAVIYKYLDAPSVFSRITPVELVRLL